MASSRTTVLDFGSSKISILVGNRTTSGALNILAKDISDYAGFMDGEFLEPSAIKNAITVAVDKIERSLNKKVRKLIVGVPAEFSYSRCVPINMFLEKKTKIRPFHLRKIFKQNAEKMVSDTHSVINFTPLYFKLDDGSRVENPVNFVSTSVQAYTSYVFIENAFINLVTSALYSAGVKKVDFIPSVVAQGLYSVEPEQQKLGALVIDCGYITTSVSYMVNFGLADVKSFSLGGGHITNDLAEVLNIPFNSAEQLKRKVVITLTGEKDYYEVLVNNKLTKFKAKTVNDIVLARVDNILETTLRAIEGFENELMPTTKVFLTGGGLSYIKGIKNYVSDYLNSDTTIAYPKPLHLNKPDLASEISLLEIAIDRNN